MRLFSSLTNRIFFACTLLAVLALGFASYFVNARVTSEADADLRREVEEASRLVDQHRSTLIDTYTRYARLVADLPRFKATVEIGDPPTIQPIAEFYREQINAALLVVRGRDGRVLAADGAGHPERLPEAAPTAELSLLWPHDRGLLQIVSVPIFVGLDQPDVFGRLSVGFLLDDRLAQQFKDATGSEVAFAAGGRVLASTFPGQARAALTPAVMAKGLSTIVVSGEEFIALRRPLSEATDVKAPVALILRSRTARLQFLRAIRNGLIGALIGTVLLATIVSYVLARTVTRPLAAVTSAMRHVAETGDLTRKVPLHSRTADDEDARLLATTFNTLTDSIATFQREAAQKERLSSLGRLATVIAHEVRNPLMIIRTSLSSLRKDGVSASELREAVADIDDETSRLNRIVTEVLDFARPIRFEYAEASVNAVCAASAQAVEASEAGAPITLDLDAGDPRLVTDAERLRTALVNILTNARHAVQGQPPKAPGGDRVAVIDAPMVTLQTRAAGDRVTITVADRGVGIAAEDMAHIFDPYYTTRRTGTGLGLPIARNIVDGLGGRIVVRSQPGAGTEMRIELPQQPPAA